MPSKLNVGIVAISSTPWDAPWRGRHHLLTRLSEDFRVVWMDPPHDRSHLIWTQGPVFRRPDPKRWPNFWVYTPHWWLPRLHRPRLAAQATTRLRLRMALGRLRASGCERFILYLIRPDLLSLATADGFHLSAYHIFDEYTYSADDPPTSDLELQVLHSVDQVVIHSSTMMEKKGRENPNTLLLPNGVDYPLHQRDWTEPDGLVGVSRPIVGYTGYLKPQLDWDLIATLVSRHPELTFVFVGPAQDNKDVQELMAVLAQQPNALFPGTVPAEQLPAWVCHFDVCIMPYKNDGYTRYIYPLKLHEYLASGRPVVGTALPTLMPYEGMIALPTSPEEWSEALKKALGPTENTPEKVLARKEIARSHDWRGLTKDLRETLLVRLSEKESAGTPPVV